MFDQRIWNTIGNKKTCAFRLGSKADTLCKNVYNVTGICDEFSCPLANTKYATVRAIGEELFLFVKEPERANNPKTMYEQIKLSEDYPTALKEIEENLEFWDSQIIHKCKQRMTKLTEYLGRLAYYKEHGMPELTVRKTKMNRREKVRALKALNSVNFEKDIGNELMLRLQSGIYGEELKDKVEHANILAKRQKKKRFVADFEESAEETEIILKKKAKKEKSKEKEAHMEW